MARRIFLHIYLMRVPILTLLVLGLLLPYALDSSMLHGLADLDMVSHQVAVVAFAAFLLLSAAVSCAFVVLLYGSERADAERKPSCGAPSGQNKGSRKLPKWWIVLLLYVAAGLLFVRFLLRLEQIMLSGHLESANLPSQFWTQAAVGTFVASVFILLIFLLDLTLSEPRNYPAIEVFALPIAYVLGETNWFSRVLTFLNNLRPLKFLRLEKFFGRRDFFSLLLLRGLGPGYGTFDEEGNPIELHPGFRFAAFLAILCFGTYLLAGNGVFHRLALDLPFRAPRPYDAVLLQVLLLMILGCWALAAFSFFFDRFRVPVLIPIGVILFLTSQFGPSDYAFHTIARSPQSTLATSDQLLERSGDHVILVAAEGGGIQSAAWSSEVLCGLRKELGPQFDQSVLAISGVSGGSVGAMFYLRCRESTPGDMQAAQAARNSSLEAIAWGLAHPDLRRAILPIHALLWPGADRGWALERALRKNAQFSPMDRPLAATDTQPNWPVVLFSATEARTGDPIVFTNSDFPRSNPSLSNQHVLRGFHRVYEGRDVFLESAVRMSASFPYVSPAARADWPWNAEHLVDGGYFDNSGLYALTNWMTDAILHLPSSSGGANPGTVHKSVLILTIAAFPDAGWQDPQDTPHKWPYQLSAPVSSLLHVRSEGQLVHDRSDSFNLLGLLSLHGYQATALTIHYSPAPEDPNNTGPLHCPEDPPLTWHLTEVEKTCIDEEWKRLKPMVLSQINAFFQEVPVPPTKAPVGTTSQRLQKGLYLQKILR